jgi:hypothetical protein
MRHAPLLALPLALSVFTFVAPATRAAADKASDASDSTAELQRLREEVRALREENDQLRQKLNELLSGTRAPDAPERAKSPAAPAAATKEPAPAKTYARIEVGMTRDEVERFIDTHPTLKRVGVRRRAEEKPASRPPRRLVDRDDEPRTIDETPEPPQTPDSRPPRTRRETITVARLAPQPIPAGAPRSTPEWKETGRLKITLTDDVVTAVAGTER